MLDFFTKPSEEALTETTAWEKMLIILSFLTFITLASLIASLPLNLPSHQYAKNIQNNSANLNNGDTAWMLFATILGLFLTPALAYLYANVYGRKTKGLLKLTLIAGAMITFLWVLFSFSLAYGKDAGNHGILGYPITFYMFRDVWSAPELPYAPTIPTSIFAIFELSFALLTPTIVLSAVHGRVSGYGWVFFVAVWHLVIYCPIAHIVWSEHGWFPRHNIIDFSGGIVVHILSAVTIVALNLFLDKSDAPKDRVRAPNVGQLLQSTLLVWFLWFGFNAGKAHMASPIAAQSIVNTIGATTSGIVTWYFIDSLLEVEFTHWSLYNAILVSLIAITPASGYVTVGGAMCIAIGTNLITRRIATHYLGELTKENPVLSLLSLHGVAGSVGFFGTAVFTYKFINPWGLNGLTFGRGIPVAYHIAAILVIWSTCFIAVFITIFATNIIVPITIEADGHKFYVPKEDRDAEEEEEEDEANALGKAATEPIDISNIHRTQQSQFIFENK